ncbi:unnamed protein product [Urochloa decumbens]|uniref:Uncharacterized protein n=1 Tax=Urochloa decumbens TaxID=240449 RepID=A0ABC9G696_9POAL
MEDGDGSLLPDPSSTGSKPQPQTTKGPYILTPPPIHAEDPEEPPPESILLDPFGYLSDRTNATTADGRRSRRSGKRSILVTFWAATPPRVSCFTVHCPGLDPSAFGDMPKVICAEDDLVLLRIAICPRDDRRDAKNIRYLSDVFAEHHCWVAETKKMKASNIGSGNHWEEDCAINIYEVPVDSPAYATMLPDLQQGQDTKLALKRIQAGYPALSLHDGDVVYIMHIPDHHEKKASVIAIDMRNKTIKGVADFGSGRPIGYEFTYLQSGISKHLGIWSTSR